MILLRAALFVAACALGVVTASAEQVGECKVVRMEGAGFLKHCGDRLQLWHLKSSDERWRSGLDLHGRFSFECFILPSKRPLGLTIYDILRSQATTGDMPRCPDQQNVGGFFFDSTQWQKSSKDASDIKAALLKMPLLQAYSDMSEQPATEVTCQAFDITVGDITARAACFRFSEVKGDFGVMVLTDAENSLVLTYRDNELLADDLKNSFVKFVQSLTIERASGDAALLRWIQ